MFNTTNSVKFINKRYLEKREKKLARHCIASTATVPRILSFDKVTENKRNYTEPPNKQIQFRFEKKKLHFLIYIKRFDPQNQQKNVLNSNFRQNAVQCKMY